MTIDKILAFEKLYPTLKELSLPIKTSYTLAKIHQTAAADVQFYQQKLFEIISKYGDKDEAGNLKQKEDFIPIKEESLKDCEKEMNELHNFDLPDYNNLKISLVDLGNIELTPDQLQSLLPFISEE